MYADLNQAFYHLKGAYHDSLWTNPGLLCISTYVCLKQLAMLSVHVYTSRVVDVGTDWLEFP